MRERAETELAALARGSGEPANTGNVDGPVHELNVHQIELQMQNEQLLQTQAELGVSRDRYFDLYQHAPIAYVTLGANSMILDANAQAVALLRLPAERLARRTLAEFFIPGDRLRFTQRQTDLLRGEGAQAIDLRLVRPGGAHTWVSVWMAQVSDPEAASRYSVALVDIDERRRLQQSVARLAAIVASSDDAIVARDTAGCVIAWNAAAERLFGYSAGEMLGQPIDRIVPSERHSEETRLLRRLLDGESVAPFESERYHRDGTRVPVALSMAPIRDESGAVIGTSTIARDIGERKRAEQAMHKRLRQLDLLAQSGQALIMNEPGATPVQVELFDRVRLAVGGQIYLHCEVHGERLQLVSSHGLSDAGRAALGSMGLAESLCGVAARRRTPLIVENLQASGAPEARLLQAEGVCSYAGFPLVAHGEVHGVAAFASTTRSRFGDGDLQVIQTVCDQVSAMLERARLLEQLEAREQSLQLADRRKDDFIATLAHELRNPLAPIVNAVGIMRRAALADPQLVWSRDVIDRQVQQMTRLLEDLLDVSRVTRNKIELRRKRIELNRIIDEAVETTRPLIDTQRHTLTLDLPAEPIVLYGDVTRLTQVLANLLNNAAKYTDPGGRIELAARRDDQGVRICVRDNGIGIEAHQLPSVFDMFAQLAPALERSRGGLGIGLSLSRGLIELHGGHIEARSEGVGRGSEFIVHLPVVHQAGEHQAESAPPGGDRAAPPLRRRVLVIDDNEDAAQTLSAMLSLQGLDVRTAFGGEEGLRMADEWRPDAAVVDIGMPELNGYELCRRIREQPWGEHMTMIACTGWGQSEDRQRARAAGFDHHLVKPIEPDAVLHCLAGESVDRHD